MRKLISVLAAICLAGLPAANWPSTSGTTIPGFMREDGAGNKLESKATYRWAQTTSTFAATFTDVWVLSGSASKTVRLNFIVLCGTATAASNLDIFLIKRSTADTGGSSVAPAGVPIDSANAAVTGTLLNYTANPTLGNGIGNVGARKLNAGVPGSAGCITWTFGPPGTGQALTLRGVAQQLAINLNGATVPAGLAVTIEIETTEE